MEKIIREAFRHLLSSQETVSSLPDGQLVALSRILNEECVERGLNPSIGLGDLGLASELFSLNIEDADTQQQRALCHYAHLASTDCIKAYVDDAVNHGCEVFYLEEEEEDPGIIHRVDGDTWLVSAQNRAVLIIESAEECEAAGYTLHYLIIDARFDRQGFFAGGLNHIRNTIIAEVEAGRR